MAFSMPPPGRPIGFGSCVKKARLSEEKPFAMRYTKIRIKGKVTNAVAITARMVTVQFTMLRLM